MSRPQGAPSAQRELTAKFKVVKFLGKGSYGSVFQVQRLSDNQTYALKEMDVRAMSQVEREDAANEIRLLASIQHPNVIGYHEAFLDGNRLCIIMEFAPDGDIAKIIKKLNAIKKPMPEDSIWRYFIQIVKAIQALHQMKILHRDIKPGNIMVTSNDVIKLGDLGIAKLLKHTMAKTQIGTPHYMPPEIWKNKPYSFTGDTWALGCVLYEMACFAVPFEARSMQELRYKVLRGSYPPIPIRYSPDLIAMVRDCLEPNPDKRPTMDQILASPAVTSRMHLLPNSMTRAVPSTAQSALLDTIRVPRNYQLLKNKLPPPQYISDMGGMRIEEDDEDVPARHRSRYSSAAAVASSLGDMKLPVLKAALPPPPPMQQRGISAAVPQQQQQQAAVSAAPKPYQQYRPLPPPPQPQPVVALPPPPVVRHRSGVPHPSEYGIPRPRVPSGMYTPSVRSEAQWHNPALDRVQVSESHANYGAFYNDPSLDPTGGAQQRYSREPSAQARQSYQGHYTPQSGYSQASYYPQPRKLAPLSAAGENPRPPPPVARPWNYGGGPSRQSSSNIYSRFNAPPLRPVAGGGGGYAAYASPYQPAY